MEKQLVVFTLGAEHFAVDIAAVESIIKMQEITKVPRTPDFVEGITNLRGAVVPVLDLRKRMDIEVSASDTSDTRIVIVSMDEKKVGMVVDAVSEVLTISDDVIEPPPPMVSTVDTAFITGVARLEGERLVILLDLAKVLSQEEQAALGDL